MEKSEFKPPTPIAVLGGRVHNLKKRDRKIFSLTVTKINSGAAA